MIKIGMVTSERLLIDVDEIIAWTNDERCTQLHRATPGLVLSMSADQGPSASANGVGTDKRGCLQSVRLHDLRSFAFVVEQHGKRYGLVLDEGLGITLASRADRGDTQVCRQKVLVSLTDLTGPLPARESPEMAEEQQYMALLCPEVPESVHVTLGIGE